MHPNLSKHLHTEECNILAIQYENCNSENKYLRLLGACSDIQNKMTKCFQNELNSKRKQGSKTNQSIDRYLKKDPKLAEKIKLLEELKKKEATGGN